MDQPPAAPAGGRWPPAAHMGGTEPQAPLRATLRAVVADAGGLLKAEASLARLETESNLRQAVAGGARMGIGGALLFLATVFLAVAAVVALANLIGLLLALLAVGFLCLLVGWILLAAGRRALGTVRLLPEQAIERVGRDLDRLAARAEATRGESHG